MCIQLNMNTYIPQLHFISMKVHVYDDDINAFDFMV